MFSKDKFETIQPIEGAKGNIAMVCYRGKYINKSMDDDTYQLESIANAFKNSTEQLTAQELVNMWLVYDDSVKRYIFRLLKITPNEEPYDSNANLWYDKSSDEHLTAFLSEPRFRGSRVLIQKHQQNDDFHYLDGWYACEKLMLKFAGWLDEEFDAEIYEAYAMSPEHERLQADNDHKATRIEELESMLKQQDRKLDCIIERTMELYVQNTHLFKQSTLLGEQNMKLHTISFDQNAKSCQNIIDCIIEQNAKSCDRIIEQNIASVKGNMDVHKAMLTYIESSCDWLHDQLLTSDSDTRKLIFDSQNLILKVAELLNACR